MCSMLPRVLISTLVLSFVWLNVVNYEPSKWGTACVFDLRTWKDTCILTFLRAPQLQLMMLIIRLPHRYNTFHQMTGSITKKKAYSLHLHRQGRLLKNMLFCPAIQRHGAASRRFSLNWKSRSWKLSKKN